MVTAQMIGLFNCFSEQFRQCDKNDISLLAYEINFDILEYYNDTYVKY